MYIENGCKLHNISKFLLNIYSDENINNENEYYTYINYLESKNKYLGNILKYLTQLHDSPILKIEFGNDISIHLNDIKTLEFAYHLCKYFLHNVNCRLGNKKAGKQFSYSIPVIITMFYKVEII